MSKPNGQAALRPMTPPEMMAKLQQQDRMIQQLAAMFAALLIHKHDGLAFVPAKVAHECYGAMPNANYFVMIDTLPELGTHRIRAMLPNQTPYVPPEKQEAKVLQMPNAVDPEKTDCSSYWHSTKDALGVRCPDCGSNKKVEAVESVSV